MRTQKQVAEEIEKLKTMKPTVRRTSVFGDDHHDAIDFQIEVLKNRMEDGDIYDAEDVEGIEENVRDAGLEAAHWLDGEDLMDGPAPSDQWKSLVV